MDSAFDKQANRIIDAVSLRELEIVDHENYACPTCSIPLIPCSYRPHNIPRPYFKEGAQKHDPECRVGDEHLNIYKKKARQESINTPDGFPVPFPNKLRLPVHKETVEKTGEPEIQKTYRDGMRKEVNTERSKRRHGHTTQSILPIAQVFIDYPHDRKHLPLELPNCDGDTYASVFRPLLMNANTDLMSLYYAPLAWNSAWVTEDAIVVHLSRGEWDDEQKKFTRQFQLKVDWRSWSNKQRNALKNQIESCIKEIRKSKQKAWVFFVGRGSKEDLIMHVNNRHLLCLSTDELIFLKPSNSS